MTTLPGFYKVEKIVGKRFVGGSPFYRVKWRDWPSSTNTYEPLENLQPVIELVNEFEAKEKQRNSTASTVTVPADNKPNPEKMRTRIRKRRQNTIGKRPIIFLKTSQKIGTHWVFGNNLTKIVRRRENDRMTVEWDNGKTTEESLQDIQQHEPELLERFMNPQKKSKRPLL